METRTSPEFYEPKKKYTSTGLNDDSTCLEVVRIKEKEKTYEEILKKYNGPIIEAFPFVYIRPMNKTLFNLSSKVKDIMFYKKAKVKKEFIFENIDSEHIFDVFLNKIDKKELYDISKISEKIFMIKCIYPENQKQLNNLIKNEFNGENDLESIAKHMYDNLGTI